MRRSGLAVLALAAGLVVAVAPAAPAFAHAALQSSVPAGESVLDEPPPAITLTFDEPVTIEPGAIRLLDSSGADVTIGLAEGGAQPSVVTASVPGIPNGAYVVAWRVISQDGHPANGAFTFQVGRGAAVDTRVAWSLRCSTPRAVIPPSTNWRRSTGCSRTSVSPSPSAARCSSPRSGRVRARAGRLGGPSGSAGGCSRWPRWPRCS